MIKRAVITILIILLATYEIKTHKVNYKETNIFTEYNLFSYIKEVGIKYPEIVMAQARLESGANFNSKLFRTTFNLFGMRISHRRRSCAIGAKNGFSVYKSWKHSVQDYKLWQDEMIHKAPTKESYLLYLKRNYAQNVQYMHLLKKML